MHPFAADRWVVAEPQSSVKRHQWRFANRVRQKRRKKPQNDWRTLDGVDLKNFKNCLFENRSVTWYPSVWRRSLLQNVSSRISSSVRLVSESSSEGPAVYTASYGAPADSLQVIPSSSGGNTSERRPLIHVMVPLRRREFVKGEESSVTVFADKISTSKWVNAKPILGQTVEQWVVNSGLAWKGDLFFFVPAVLASVHTSVHTLRHTEAHWAS